MVDTISRVRRSENMRRIKSSGMIPEWVVRSLVHRLGYRFRLHARELPGKPDIVRRPHKQAIFVHGCFWHQHPKEQCLDARLPKSNTSYWHPKLSRNVERDKFVLSALKKIGWRVLVIWECETKNIEAVERRLCRFLKS